MLVMVAQAISVSAVCLIHYRCRVNAFHALTRARFMKGHRSYHYCLFHTE